MILDIDVSASMGATDAAPSRLAVAKAAARYLVRHAPGSARIGVVAFGPTAVIVERPTRDHAAAVRAIDALSRGGGTSVAAGILTGLEAIAGKSLHVAQLAAGGSGRVRIGYYGNATIVLVSDGEDSVHTDPLPPARLASAAGVRIDTLGVGTTEGTTLKLGTFEVATALSPSTLEGVARVSNGTYHPLGPLGHPGRPGHRHGEGDQALEAVNRAIVVHLGLAGERTEVTALFAAAGAVLLAAGAVVSIRSQGRVV